MLWGLLCVVSRAKEASEVLKGTTESSPSWLQASKLIMDHMAKEPFELAWWPILALVLLLANARMHAVDSFLAAWAFAGVAVAGYLHYVICVISEICGFLGISCLTIKPSKD
jgi:ethanolaminephosphotransferase